MVIIVRAEKRGAYVAEQLVMFYYYGIPADSRHLEIEPYFVTRRIKLDRL